MRRPDIPVLTTLRFPAAFAILLYHFLALSPCPHWVYDGFSSGVSFFYVLSGFILFYNYFDLPDRGLFWMARLARVWPTHLATLALVLALLPFSTLDGHQFWPLTLPVNVLLLQAWIPSPNVALSYNGVAWSLSVEAFFYFSFPWLLRTMQQRGPALLLLGSFVLGLALLAVTMTTVPSRTSSVALFNPLCRVFEFILGMATCRLWMGRRESPMSARAWLLLEFLALAATLGVVMGIPQILQEMHVVNQLPYWLGTEACALDFAVVIWIFAHQKGALARGLSARAFEWFGEISFAVYMCHQILIRWLFSPPYNPSFGLPGSLLGLTLLTLAVSAALFHFVETPARRAIIAAYKRRRSLQTAPRAPDTAIP